MLTKISTKLKQMMSRALLKMHHQELNPSLMVKTITKLENSLNSCNRIVETTNLHYKLNKQHLIASKMDP
jgi:hypothetical protein